MGHSLLEVLFCRISACLALNLNTTPEEVVMAVRRFVCSVYRSFLTEPKEQSLVIEAKLGMKSK
jgi:hypothetical protein